MDQVDCCTLPTIFLVLLLNKLQRIDRISLSNQTLSILQHQLLSVCGTWRKGLETYMGTVWNATIELVICKAHNYL